ncbi:MAG: hypothetical protein Kow0059_08120 [Candidatus Sumerlaeia bacterium]
MLKWLEALMGENLLPAELRTPLTEQTVLRAIDNQRQIIDALDRQTRWWEKAGTLDVGAGPLVLVDPHWYQSDFDPFQDEAYWIMAELQVPAPTAMVEIMAVGDQPKDRGLGIVRLLFDRRGLDRIEREQTALVDLECMNILLVCSRGHLQANWRIGGPRNQCQLSIEQRSRRQLIRDHQQVVEALNRAGFYLKPLSHGLAREFEAPLSDKDLARVRDLLAETSAPARVTCTTAQTFAEVEEELRGRLFAPCPGQSGTWAYAFDVPSDGVVFTLRCDGAIIGYEIDFLAGLKQAFQRQKDLLEQSIGKVFRAAGPK